ncbi:hypothetical protein F4777DRAFT_26231 [Nemania sp. FL0916]|nr:hypothetical protein F4777DRAFT_26231 [Nemania sp. FL0916]
MEAASPARTDLAMDTVDAGASEFVLESTNVDAVPRRLELRLYLSHFLSTWNSRVFEFAATLFLAAVYPNTLLQVSIYALVRSAAAIIFSRALGLLIDRRGRLAVVRLSIVGRGLAVSASCAIFWVLLAAVTGGKTRTALFAVAIILAAVEKLSSVANLVAVERDWVVVITEGNAASRQLLNARMRRIDLICKLVFHAYPALRRERGAATEQASTQAAPRTSFLGWIVATAGHISPVSSLAFYFRHSVFAPSFALSLLYLTVLSFSGQMITFLLAVGYTSLYIGIARTVSTIFEVSATWIAPRLIRRLGPVRAGLWGINWQIAWVAGGFVWFFLGLNGVGPGAVTSNPIFIATGLAAAVAFSRVGLWVYDLSAQNIIQDVSMDGRERHRPSRDNSTLTRMRFIEHRARVPGVILDYRGGISEPLRASVVCDNDNLSPSGPIPLASSHQRSCRVRRRHRLQLFCAKKSGPLGSCTVFGPEILVNADIKT